MKKLMSRKLTGPISAACVFASIDLNVSQQNSTTSPTTFQKTISFQRNETN